MDKRINCNNCPLFHVEVDTYCEQYCSDMADFIDETKADVIDEIYNIIIADIPDRIKNIKDSGLYI